MAIILTCIICSVIFVGLIYKTEDNFLCAIGCHRWDSPGGHCEDCGLRDNFFD